MKFSIIVPSFNQELFIADTLKNLVEIKQKAIEKGIGFEILIFGCKKCFSIDVLFIRYISLLFFISSVMNLFLQSISVDSVVSMSYSLK